MALWLFQVVSGAAGRMRTQPGGTVTMIGSPTCAWLLDQLASLPGYDPGRRGERIATLPLRH